MHTCMYVSETYSNLEKPFLQGFIKFPSRETKKNLSKIFVLQNHFYWLLFSFLLVKQKPHPKVFSLTSLLFLLSLISLSLWMILSFILGGAREAMTWHLCNTCYVPVTVLATPTCVISLNHPHSHRAAILPTVWHSAVNLSETTQLIRSLSDFTRYTT